MKCTQYGLYGQAAFKNAGAKSYLPKSGGAGSSSFQLGSENFRFVLWGLPGDAGSQAPVPIHLPPKVRRGRFSIRPGVLGHMYFQVWPRNVINSHFKFLCQATMQVSTNSLKDGWILNGHFFLSISPLLLGYDTCDWYKMVSKSKLRL